MKKLKVVNRKKLEFEYEFLNGTTIPVSYQEATSKDIELILSSSDVADQIKATKQLLAQNLKCEDSKDV